MNATLYRPNQEPESILGHDFTLPSIEGYVEVTAEVAEILGCLREEVDVLATGSNYVVYSIFDSVAAINVTAMLTLEKLTDGVLAFERDDEELRGSVLVVHDEADVS